MMHVILPWELVEEILYRVPPLSLIRFKIVCKQWNTLFKSKSFVNNHLVRVRPQFLLWTDSKMYSVSVNLNNDPKIDMRELPLDISYLNNCTRTSFTPCDGLLFCDSWSWENKAAVWNPWLRQTKWIKFSEDKHFLFRGIGYDSGRPEKGHKIFGSGTCKRELSNDTFGPNTMPVYRRVDIYKLETNVWKSINTFSKAVEIRTCSDVSLNGNLYWVLTNHDTDEYFIESFDFSKEIYKFFCALPWDYKSFAFPVLSTFRKNRLSVLKRMTATNNTEIWVTKDKINDDGEHVAWIKFMTVSVPISSYSRPSYFIDNVYQKSLIMCCEDENSKLCIYIVRGNALTKTQIIGVDAKHFINYCSYVPSLIPVP
ncbi:LOW QUALITY PROTEIN: putative F-box/kelch-repeat protein At1g12170 [Arabidopsis lyrata subsp. lyrata]|uniref:LOW QUALITY PROTEIN: putative F-box/kelch-repeat protein At1g12170 n=1 Tax=Arabidopsis lyrata subsp. lyrata TaxID=81972 RepID=UPI000A29DA9B|nr:LOW QUALITY PROTEIN: putative F-box/kelch-repeat protein At1g12170 [Arabidopsis lyrata subsp. lyrata]|eukprot:XP_020867288.1 LOW QUALITY PROTEIN: putative F-box/kelch-repeat protein At1g12170 [Arabidopsis lyrata subsp. lyrata]